MIQKAIIRGIVALVLLLGAVLLVSGTYSNFKHWQSLSGSFRAVNILLVAGIAGLALGAALLLIGEGWRRRGLLTGGAAAALIGATIMWGVLSGVIPCSGPS
jgi:lysylphosphatidylglycerol synthetase-like protein (DUF2156 family)